MKAASFWRGVLISTYSRWPDACRWGLAHQQILSIYVKGSQLTTVLVANIEDKQLLSEIYVFKPGVCTFSKKSHRSYGYQDMGILLPR